MRDLDRSAMPRRPRRRRHTTPWLQRNALSVAALSVLIALLGLGFGLVQVLNRPEPAPALMAVSTPEQAPMMVAASTGVTSLPLALPIGVTSSGAREITTAARVIEPNYTVAQGDTLGRIASNYNTTVERIQAFNNIPDARALRIGARLVIPPPL